MKTKTKTQTFFTVFRPIGNGMVKETKRTAKAVIRSLHIPGQPRMHVRKSGRKGLDDIADDFRHAMRW